MSRLRAAGIRRLLLEVAEDNEAARRLYQAAGLVPVGRRPGYYRVGDAPIAALIMALDMAAARPGGDPAGDAAPQE